MKLSKKELLYMTLSFFMFSAILMGALFTLERSYLSETLKKSNLQMESILPKDYHYRFHSEPGISRVEYRSFLVELRKYCSIKELNLFYILELREGKILKSLKLPTSVYEKMNPYSSNYMQELRNKKILEMSKKLMAERKLSSRLEDYIFIDGKKYMVSLVYNRDYFGNEYILGVGRSFESFLLKGLKRSLLTFSVVLTIVILNGIGAVSLMKKIKERELLAVRDELTGLYTRKYLSIIEKKIQTSRGRCWGLVYTDLDNLKVVNDRFGHDAGDRYILTFTQLLNSSFRKREDYIVRMGGDEFLVVTVLSNEEELSLLSKRLKIKKTSSLMFSLGAAYIKSKDTHNFTFNRFLTEVDKKMYEDKRVNKNKNFLLDSAIN